MSFIHTRRHFHTAMQQFPTQNPKAMYKNIFVGKERDAAPGARVECYQYETGYVNGAAKVIL
jgi:hypothetical protein